MKERQLLQAFTAQVRGLPGLYWRKEGDTFGGHKKDCDVYGIFNGSAFLIEFKKEDAALAEHQRAALMSAEGAGGYTFVAEFIKGPRHERDVSFYPVRGGVKMVDYAWTVFWEKGKYTDLDRLFIQLFFTHTAAGF